MNELINTMMASSTPTIDYERLDRLHGGSRSQILAVTTLFLDDVLPDFDPLADAVRQQQWASVADMAHKIVPWIGMVGLTSLETELRQLEIRAKTNPVANELTNHFWQIRDGIDQAIPLLRQELDKLTAAQ